MFTWCNEWVILLSVILEISILMSCCPLNILRYFVLLHIFRKLFHTYVDAVEMIIFRAPREICGKTSFRPSHLCASNSGLKWQYKKTYFRNLLTDLLLTNLLHWSRILLKKLIVPEFFKKFPALYGNWRHIIVYTKTLHSEVLCNISGKLILNCAPVHVVW
jgi:hypothetical protein